MRSSRPALSLTCAAASWGVATVLSKRAVEEIAPLALLPIQLSVSVLTLALLTGFTRSRQPTGPLWTPAMRRLALLGVLNPGAAYALSLLGLLRITAGLSVLLWALEPVLILLLARAVLGDRVTLIRVFAVLTAVGGVGLVVWQSSTAGDALGIALTVTGVAACAIYTVLCRRFLAADTALRVVLVQQVSALVFALALWASTLPSLGAAPYGSVSGTAWVSAVASGVLYYALAFWLYLTGLREVAASTAAVYLTLIPVFGVAAALILLGEDLSGRQRLGATVVVAAVGTVVLLGREAKPAAV